MTEKKFTGVLIINYKTSSYRVLKEKIAHKGTLKESIAQVKTTPWEIPIRFNIMLRIPESKDIIMKGDIEIPQTKVHEMFMESL